MEKPWGRMKESLPKRVAFLGSLVPWCPWILEQILILLVEMSSKWDYVSKEETEVKSVEMKPDMQEEDMQNIISVAPSVLCGLGGLQS